MSINPYYMASFNQWASFSLPLLEKYGPISNPPAEDGWKTWASDVISLDEISSKGAPSPFGFSSWKEWAARLIEVLDDGS